ncbi:hypothetical protein CHS0354_005540 [Potamilus streckersoni]|uniref:Uncharacterized protein n=1 Tax=Potamilus streckersoni TaxID=2493646 RepID=A0AAE0VK16_9BIVA|nr:hypothetical protein CHS0354_005540 [Potamilus streckersoni]
MSEKHRLGIIDVIMMDENTDVGCQVTVSSTPTEETGTVKNLWLYMGGGVITGPISTTSLEEVEANVACCIVKPPFNYQDPFLLRHGSQPTANKLPLLNRLLRHGARNVGPIL